MSTTKVASRRCIAETLNTGEMMLMPTAKHRNANRRLVEISSFQDSQVCQIALLSNLVDNRLDVLHGMRLIGIKDGNPMFIDYSGRLLNRPQRNLLALASNLQLIPRREVQFLTQRLGDFDASPLCRLPAAWT